MTTTIDSLPDPQAVALGKNTGGREETVWIAHPSPLGYFPHMILACLFAGALFPYAPMILQRIIDLSAGVLPWTQAGADRTLILLRIGIFLPALAVLAMIGALRFTRFELTTQRLRVCRGILMRRHDEIALHRIRDYIVKRPLFGLIWGYGSIRLMTRDPSLPVLDMQWIPRAYDKSQEIRSNALIWKDRMGYREFDTGSLS